MPKLEQIFKYSSATEGEFVAFLYCIELGVPPGKCQPGEFFCILWNVYNGFSRFVS